MWGFWHGGRRGYGTVAVGDTVELAPRGRRTSRRRPPDPAVDAQRTAGEDEKAAAGKAKAGQGRARSRPRHESTHARARAHATTAHALALADAGARARACARRASCHAAVGMSSVCDAGLCTASAAVVRRRRGGSRRTGRHGSSNSASRTTDTGDSSARCRLKVGAEGGSTPSKSDSGSPSETASLESSPPAVAAVLASDISASEKRGDGQACCSFGRAELATPEAGAPASAPGSPAPAEGADAASHGPFGAGAAAPLGAGDLPPPRAPSALRVLR